MHIRYNDSSDIWEWLISTGPDVWAKLPIDGSQLTSGIVTLDGFKFPATQVPSSNANTLDDYEEGTWTPIDRSGAGLTFASLPIAAQYVKIGQEVLATCGVIYPVTANASQMQIGGFPFTNQATQYAASILYHTTGLNLMGFLQASDTAVTYFNATSGAAITNAVMSAKDIRFTCKYRAAA